MTTTALSLQDRLESLRSHMKQSNVEAYIIPSEDAHQSEYIASCDARRSYISGFTGSAGLAIVSHTSAALWTDGRYFLQASQQLPAGWELQKMGMPKTPSKENWLISQFKDVKSRVGIDPRLITVTDAQQLSESLTKQGHELVSLPQNLVDLVWNESRPAPPNNSIMILDAKYTGKSFQDKLKHIREKLSENKVYGFVVHALDEVAWLLNLRGSDIPFNPVFFAYAVVTMDDAILYVDAKKLSPETITYLEDSVRVRPYEAIFSELRQLASSNSAVDQKYAFWLDPRCSLALKNALNIKSNDRLLLKRSPVQTAKALKTPEELEGFRQCHIRDASALCRYFAWLEDELVNQKNSSISEVAAADKLEGFRKSLDKFVGLSFDTISSTGPNGAIIHYKPEPETCSMIQADQIYLCDSGAQYLDGTTDVTRTLHFGEPTDEEKDAFTRVLKGHIQMDMMVFPHGTTGYIIDCVSRMPLWRNGFDFQHGTGHGVGSFLNVHEGPHGIGTRIAYNDIPLEAGMTVTNEPGFYKNGAFGIRIENVLLIKKIDTPNRFGDRDYLGFEHVTLVPIQTKLINKELLLPEEREWINKYHKKCFDVVGPLVSNDEAAYAWLQRETQSI